MRIKILCSAAEDVTRCRETPRTWLAPFAPAGRAHHGPKGAYFTRECEICGLGSYDVARGAAMWIAKDPGDPMNLAFKGLFVRRALCGALPRKRHATPRRPWPDNVSVEATRSVRPRLLEP